MASCVGRVQADAAHFGQASHSLVPGTWNSKSRPFFVESCDGPAKIRLTITAEPSPKKGVQRTLAQFQSS